MRERQLLAAVVELARVEALNSHPGILRREGRRVAREHEEGAGREPRAVGEGEGKAVGEAQSAQIQCVRAGVFQFEEFHLITVGRPEVRRAIHDLRHLQRGKILHDVKRRFDERTPVGAVAHAGADEHGVRQRQRPGVQLCGGSKRAAPLARIGAVEREVNRAGRIRVREREQVAGRNQPAKRREARRVELRVKAGVAELIEEDARALRKPGEHGGLRVQPGLARVAAAPAG